MEKKLLLIILIIIFIKSYNVKAQTQITDITTTSADKSSNPFGFIRFNNQIFFTATTEDIGNEIWMSDGSGSNTRIIKDINPGRENGVNLSLKQSSVILNNKLFFIANDGENGNQIWATQGTEQSTTRITNIAGLNATKLTLVGNHIFFLIKHNDLLQIWETDGTTQGTVLVKKDLTATNNPSYEGTANNLFFFTFQQKGSNSCKVWRSDGTDSGTFAITSLLDGNGAGSTGTSSLTQYIVFQNNLYFVVRSSSYFQSSTSVGIMKTDGSIANTLPVKGIHDGNTRLITFADVILVNNKMYFSFFEANYNRLFIWESDGTASGTKKIYDQTNSKYFAPSNLSTDGSNLIFTGKNSRNETSLIKMRLSDYQTEEIKELAVNIAKPFIFFGDLDAYQINTLNNNRYLIYGPIPLNNIWVSDLSAANTTLVSNINIALQRDFIINNEEIYFSRTTQQEGAELYKSNFLLNNPTLILNINSSKYGISENKLAILNDKVFFSTNDGINGTELWVYNHTTKDKKLLKNIADGAASSYPDNFIIHNNYIYFSAHTTAGGSQIWKSDGSEAGTVKVDNLENSTFYLNFLTKAFGKLFFIARLNNRYVLCATDGTKIDKIKDLGVNQFNVTFSVKELLATDNYIYFITDAEGLDLWRSNGTESGTFKIKDFYVSQNLTSVNNNLYFTATTEFGGEIELWKSDGSASGTTLFKNIGDGYSSKPDHLINLSGQLIFSANTKEFGREYWKSDGSPEGTVQIIDINPGPASSVLSNSDFNNDSYSIIGTPKKAYTIAGNNLYFAALTNLNGTELWRTNGSVTGTSIIKDIYSGPTGSQPNSLAQDGNKVYFSAFTPETGTELWVTEGTDASTKPLFDLNSGHLNSNPNNLVFYNKDLFFFAQKGNSGLQLWNFNESAITGINDFLDSKKFNVYPNPASDFLYLVNSNLKIKSLEIYNLQGQRFPYDKNFSDKIYVGNLPSGIYFLVVKEAKKTFTTKFIKK